jgi:hypothetical protein
MNKNYSVAYFIDKLGCFFKTRIVLKGDILISRIFARKSKHPLAIEIKQGAAPSIAPSNKV